MKIGLQVYTVRDAADKDFKGTMEKIKEMGYDGVELAGLCGKTVEEVAAIMKEGHDRKAAGHAAEEPEHAIMQSAHGAADRRQSRRAEGVSGDISVDDCIAQVQQVHRKKRRRKCQDLPQGVANRHILHSAHKKNPSFIVRLPVQCGQGSRYVSVPESSGNNTSLLHKTPRSTPTDGTGRRR